MGLDPAGVVIGPSVVHPLVYLETPLGLALLYRVNILLSTRGRVPRVPTCVPLIRSLRSRSRDLLQVVLAP